jgi:hypothetical protein
MTYHNVLRLASFTFALAAIVVTLAVPFSPIIYSAMGLIAGMLVSSWISFWYQRLQTTKPEE